jgi:hypothetical protein
MAVRPRDDDLAFQVGADGMWHPLINYFQIQIAHPVVRSGGLLEEQGFMAGGRAGRRRRRT